MYDQAHQQVWSSEQTQEHSLAELCQPCLVCANDLGEALCGQAPGSHSQNRERMLLSKTQEPQAVVHAQGVLQCVDAYAANSFCLWPAEEAVVSAFALSTVKQAGVREQDG